MRKLLLFIALVLMMVFFTANFTFSDEFELGLSLVPIGIVLPDNQHTEPYPEERPDEYNYEEQQDILNEWLFGLHLAYAMSIFYVSLDSFIMPPFLVAGLTSRDVQDEDTGEWYSVNGLDRPGFLNFIDAGIRFTLGKFVLFAETGINLLYVYRQDELPEEQKPGTIGTNLRLGLSYKFLEGLSVGLTGTAIFPDFKTMSYSLQGIFGDEKYYGYAQQVKFLPILMVALYL